MGRAAVLSREQVIQGVISVLYNEGEDGLTMRAVAAMLSCGTAALYHHIKSKDEMLVAATDAVIGEALAGVRSDSFDAIRAIAAEVFDTVEEHPWVGTQLSRAPWTGATLQIFERIGQQLNGRNQFTSAITLVSYIIGISAQNAGQGRALPPGTTRAAYLAAEAERWKNLDAAAYPFTRRVSAQLRKHDDRAEFLAGLELILSGIAT